MLSCDQILAIPLSRPDQLFSGRDEEAKAQWRSLRNTWHPDRSLVSGVFEHIEALYAARAAMLAAGTWPGAGDVQIALVSGTMTIHYLRSRPFEYGTMYITPKSVIYVSGPEARRAMCAGPMQLDRLYTSPATLKAKAGTMVPGEYRVSDTKAGGVAVILPRDPDSIALSDILAHTGGPLGARHVAWILTRLHHLTTYLDVVKMTHNAIAPETCFISPASHTLSLVGGWWFAAPHGEPIAQLPVTSLPSWRGLPSAVTRAKLATPLLDRELVRMTARTLLGDASGATLLRNPDIPTPLARWVTTPSAVDGLTDYRAWETAREASFGPRSFTILPLTAAEVYRRHPVSSR